MKVKEVADLVGILQPDDTTESGYRLYFDGNLAELQQILFSKRDRIFLKEIKEVIKSPLSEFHNAHSRPSNMHIVRNNPT